MSALIQCCFDRDFSEDIDLAENYGGDAGLEKGLETNLQKGIIGSPSDLSKRINSFSKNEQQTILTKNFWDYLKILMDNVVLRFLIVVAGLQIAVSVGLSTPDDRSQSWSKGFAIILGVILTTLVSALSLQQNQRQFDLLRDLTISLLMVNVVRNGTVQKINARLLTVGDVVLVEEGQVVPVDGYVIDATDLEVDQSPINGILQKVKKDQLKKCVEVRDKLVKEGGKKTAGIHDVPSCVLLSGSKITRGNGKIITIAVGKHSCMAQTHTDNSETSTPFQNSLFLFGQQLSKYGIFSSLLLFLIFMVRFTIERGVLNSWNHSTHWLEMIDYLLIMVTILMMSLPFTLLKLVYFITAHSLKGMQKNQILLKKQEALETLAIVNEICFNQNDFFITKKPTLACIQNVSLIKLDNKKLGDLFQVGFLEVLEVSCLVNRPEERSQTDNAVLEFFESQGTKQEAMSSKYKYQVISHFPQDGKRKRTSTLIKIKEYHMILVYGPPEVILPQCEFFHDSQFDKVRKIDTNFKKQFKYKNIQQMVDYNLTPVVHAYKYVSKGINPEIEKRGFTVIALLGFSNIFTDDVQAGIAQCWKAGINVRMFSDDNIENCKSLALKWGLIKENEQDAIIEGSKFLNLVGGVGCQQEGMPLGVKNGQTFDEILPHLKVIANCRPQDKQALIIGLRERKRTVAVVSGEKNLMIGDINLSMGLQGSEAAREASGIVLTSDSFKSIVTAIAYGRNVYSSVFAYLQYSLTLNFTCHICSLVCSVVLKQIVFAPVQILWFMILTNTFGALQLATSPPDPSLLEQAPQTKKFLITRKMLKHIMGQCILQITIILLLVFDGENFLPEHQDLCNIQTDCFDLFIINRYQEAKATGLIWPGELNQTIKISYNNTSYDYPYHVRYSDSGLNYVANGRLKSYSTMYNIYQDTQDTFDGVKSRHFTYIFNVFVMFQFWNFFNCRKLKDEKNIFQGLTANNLFFQVLGIILMTQTLLVTYGGKPFQVYSFKGLGVNQWLICIGFGMLALVWRLILVAVPDNSIIKFNLGWEEESEKQDDKKLLKTFPEGDQSMLKEIAIQK